MGITRSEIKQSKITSLEDKQLADVQLGCTNPIVCINMAA